MFGIGGTEILVILLVALLVLGPRSLPQIAKTLGKALREFRRVSTDFQHTINTELVFEEHEKRQKEGEAKQQSTMNSKNDETIESTQPIVADDHPSSVTTSSSLITDSGGETLPEDENSKKAPV